MDRLRSFLFAFCFVLVDGVLCYNFDARNVDAVSSLQVADYFGYSLILRNDGSILVGAPKGNSTYKIEASSPGVLYTCKFGGGTCEEHDVNKLGINGIGELEDGALFAMTMDGGSSAVDNPIVCAPRPIKVESGFAASYFTNGACRFLNDNKKIAPLGKSADQIDLDPAPYYKYAFAEMGMSVKYLKDRNNILFGAPGLYSWSGGLLRSEINSARVVVSSRNAFGYSLYDYIGYSLDVGKFTRNSNEYWGVTGAPRAQGLLGKVQFFSTSRISMSIKALNGENIGTYFGASLLAVDVNANGIDDLFVGAPTYSLNQYDEGCVYFYKSKGDGNFHDPIKIFGTQAIASRFGTTIADLGDINHDGFKDVAISAPYEQGTGAIYIYLGNPEGITEKYSQRILPEDFKDSISGFGISISRGVDVDGNSYNDVAVGAYTSGKVVLIRSQAIMEYGTSLTALKKELSPNEQEEFGVRFCIRMVSDVSNVVPVETDLEMILDDRVTSDFYQQTINVTSNLYCLNITLKLTNNIFGSTNPIAISMEYHQRPRRSTEFCSNCPVVNPSESSRVVLEIPFAHGCGNDGVCNTQLSITGSFQDTSSLVLGSSDVVSLKVQVKNEGEPAYLSQLYVVLPQDVNFAQVPTGCTLELQKLKCLVGNNFIKGQTKQMSFDLDVSKIDNNAKSLDVFFNVSSVGLEITPEDNELTLKLPVVLDIKPQVIGKAFPDQATFVNKTESVSIKHLFVVSNLGKSPFDVRATLAIPAFINLASLKVEASRNNEPGNPCDTISQNSDFDVASYNLKLNRTQAIFCGSQEIVCSFVTCNIGQLTSSSHVAVITVEMKVEPTIYEKFSEVDAIAIGTIAHVIVSGESVTNDTSTLLFESQKAGSIPLWITIAASIGGLLIVIVIVIIMWKCNFFRRTYKEKLLSEEDETAGVDSNER